MTALALFRPLIYAILFRAAGEEKPWLGKHQGQLGRILFWALPVGVDLMIVFPPLLGFWWSLAYLVAIIFLLFLGLAIGPWGQWFDMGRNHDTFKSDFLNMLWRGALITGFAGALMCFASVPVGIIFGLCGAMTAPARALGWKVPTATPQLEQGPEWGEFLTGLCIGAVVTALQFWLRF